MAANEVEYAKNVLAGVVFMAGSSGAELLAYLAANRDIYRTDTFLNIMRHVRAQQAKWKLAK